jgi:phosphoribosylamine--glycine ligase
MKVVKHVKSNAIVLVKNRQTVGIGPGQPNRITSARIAINQRGNGPAAPFSVRIVFPLCRHRRSCGACGVAAIIQPGGSLRDQDSIDACNQAGIPMVFTGHAISATDAKIRPAGRVSVRWIFCSEERDGSGFMKILIVGGGGREHAIAWKLRQSPKVDQLFCAPGNAGIAQIATCVPIRPPMWRPWCSLPAKRPWIWFSSRPTIPWQPAWSMRWKRQPEGFRPSQAAARIESSKAFAKDLMRRYRIPTADYAVFDAAEPALQYLASCDLPIVIKADGLALGKGVIIAGTRQEAEMAVIDMLEGNKFGAAGKRVVIEQFLTGPELTVLAFTDGKTIRPMVSSRDHKRAYDGDRGPNTGGMGTIAPGASLTAAEEQALLETIFQPTIAAMAAEGCPFRGVLYFGLMLTPKGPMVIEYNARFGDPEAQVVLPLLATDLVDICEAVIAGTLDQIEIKWLPEYACCVIMASGGYPGPYETGLPIEGLDQGRA